MPTVPDAFDPDLPDINTVLAGFVDFLNTPYGMERMFAHGAHEVCVDIPLDIEDPYEDPLNGLWRMMLRAGFQRFMLTRGTLRFL